MPSIRRFGSSLLLLLLYLLMMNGACTGTTSIVTANFGPRGYSPPTPINYPCIDTWAPLPGGQCYLLSSEPNMDIWDAEMQCRQYGGHLPSIRSEEQSNVIQGYLQGRKYQNTQFWLGLYCVWDEDYEAAFGRIGKREWIDGSPYNTDEYSNFVDTDDNTCTCNVGMVDTFVYNGILKGKWQKQRFNYTVTTLLCTRPDPQPIPFTPTTTKKTTKGDQSTTLTDANDDETTTVLTKTTTIEPENAESTIEHSTRLITLSTSQQPSTASSTNRHILVIPVPMLTLIYTSLHGHN